MRKIIFLTIVCILISGCGNQANSGDSLETAKQEDDLEGIEVFGTVKPKKIKHISLDFDVEILQIHISEGDEVQAGSSLLTLDLTSIHSIIRNREHASVIARLELKKLGEEYAKNNKKKNSEYRSLKNSIQIARKELEKIEAEYEEKKLLFTERTDPDIKKLLNEIETSKGELENSLKELENKKELLTLCEKLQDVAPSLKKREELKKLFVTSREADNHIGRWIQENMPEADIIAGSGDISAVKKALPPIFKKYFFHNRSFLNFKFIGFPFHYWYTSMFLLIMFVVMCIIYAKWNDKANEKYGIKEDE